MRRRSFLSIVGAGLLAPFAALRNLKRREPEPCKHAWASGGGLAWTDFGHYGAYPDKPFIRVVEFYAKDGGLSPSVVPDLFRRCRRCGVSYKEVRERGRDSQKPASFYASPLATKWEILAYDIPREDCSHEQLH